MRDPLTYVYPRTMEQAFGERGELHEPDEMPPMQWQDKLVLWVAPAAVAFLIILFALEGV